MLSTPSKRRRYWSYKGFVSRQPLSPETEVLVPKEDPTLRGPESHAPVAQIGAVEGFGGIGWLIGVLVCYSVGHHFSPTREVVLQGGPLCFPGYERPAFVVSTTPIIQVCLPLCNM